MKLLGWMHRKLKHNLNEAAKNNRTTSFDNDDDDQKYLQFQEEGHELFHGFLSIGTLGDSEPFNTQPPTPTFPTSFDETHETTNITDQDLKFISKELEKFLEAAEEEDNNIDEQSSKRSSYASIITLSGGKQLLDVDDNDHKTQQDSLLDCPLHTYFYGSSIIHLSSDADADIAAVKKEHEEDQLVVKAKCAGDNKKGNKAHLFAKNFMKKMFNNLNSKSKSHAPSSNGITSTKSPSIKNKLPKVLKMLKKKVHPERFIDVKDENRVINPNDHSRADTVSQMMSPEDDEYFGSGAFAFMENNKEHWIKTDADYLVLEL